MISGGTKKKEIVGRYKHNGQQWRPAGKPVRVNVHDFHTPALGTSGTAVGASQLIRSFNAADLGCVGFRRKTFDTGGG